MHDLAVTGGAVLLGADLVRVDVAVDDGRVSALTTDPLEAARRIDATGLTVLPGVVDQHYHSWWGYGFESHVSGSRAAAKGGVTTVLEMPLDTPLSLTVDALAAKEAQVGGEYLVDHAPIGGYLAEQPDQLAATAAAGVVAYKLFTGLVAPPGMYPGSDGNDMLTVMRVARDQDLPVIVHCEDAAIVDGETARLQALGRSGPRAWDEARSRLAEVSAVQQVALLAEETGARVVIAHVPTPRSVEVVAAARDRGADIWVESCPHQLCLRLEDFGDDTRLKWNPPTRDAAQVDAMWEHLRAGRVHCVGSDHAPLPKLDGADVWSQNPGAGNVLETMLSVTLTEGLRRGVALHQLVGMFTSVPARLFGLHPRKGTIQVGSDADLAIVDLGSTRRIAADELEFHDPDQRWTPYEGREVTVRHVHTLLRGIATLTDGRISAEPGCGRLIAPSR